MRKKVLTNSKHFMRPVLIRMLKKSRYGHIVVNITGSRTIQETNSEYFFLAVSRLD